MSNQANQIRVLFQQGNTPAQISELLSMALIDVLLVLNSIGLINGNSRVREHDGNNQDSSSNDEKEAQNLFKANQVLMAQRIIAIACDPDSPSAAAKCAIYANEEATGRNDARAKKLGQLGKIVNIQMLLQNRDQAKNILDSILSGGNDKGELKQIPQGAIAV